jgi:AMME syndrome candidate gene 1 protein
VERHGVIIEFDLDGRTYSATYLPDVAMEQGWDQGEAINSLIKKSGYNGRSGFPNEKSHICLFLTSRH